MNYNQERISSLLENIVVDLYYMFGVKNASGFNQKFRSYLFTNYNTHEFQLLRPDEEKETILYLMGAYNLILMLKSNQKEEARA